MRLVNSALLASTVLVSSAIAAQAEITVVASIKPIHSLVAGVMEGVGEPGLIVKGAGSPHTYAMRPSEAQDLQSADVVFWIGHDLESFLEGALENIAEDAKTVELIDAHDLIKLDFREGGGFEKHDHGDHGDHGDHAHEHGDEHDHDHAEEAAHDHDHDHGEEAAHDHGDEHDHEHAEEVAHDHDHDHDHDHGEKAAEAGHDHDHDHSHEAADAGHDHDHDHSHDDEMAEAGHDHDHGHSHEGGDTHVWLDPVNAKAMVHEIEEALVEADPANAATYEANAEAVTARLDALIAEVETELAGLEDQGFIVFHDAYQYFENRFGLQAAGSVTVSPEVMPGAARISELRERVQNAAATCVFSEPQFEPQLVSTVTEGTDARTGVLDPLGAELENGPDLYFELIRNLTTSFKDCLSPAS